jgi:hypothetical protein
MSILEIEQEEDNTEQEDFDVWENENYPNIYDYSQDQE